MEFYNVPAKNITISGEFDVVVCGGGPSGCAAAIAAAGNGAKTLLIEKYGYLGGATVSQFVMPVLSMNGLDFEGVWHEWAYALDEMGGMGELRKRRGRLVDGSVDPELVKYVWDKLLTAAGARILHHAWVSEVMMDHNAICGVIVETVAGAMAIKAGRVVDCTGDGTVCNLAGVPWEQGDGKSKCAMAMTKPFRLGNAVMPEDFPSEEYNRKIDDDFKKAMESGEFSDPIITSGRIVIYLKNWTRPLANRPEMLVGGPSRILNVNPLDPWELSEAERTARAQIRQVKDYYLKYCPGCENAYFLDSSNHIGTRSTRRIQGIAKVTGEDAFNFKKSPLSIAKSSWQIDVWPADSFTASADKAPEGWNQKVYAGEYFDIPYGCLVADTVDNLLAGGRCISADHYAQSSLRIQQTCMATGEAAGTIAAMSLKAAASPRCLDPLPVVNLLKEKRKQIRPFYRLFGK
ncbi:MAG: FAD-dependent oxidoreductase [Lentisphaerota bacterium]